MDAETDLTDEKSKSTLMDEIELMDTQVELAGRDEMQTMFDPETHPRDHRREDPDEPVCDDCGNAVDMMSDTDAIEEELGFDLSIDDLADVDID